TLAPGESYLVYKRGTDPVRGDLVVFAVPGSGAVTVRRVIGLPGDRIEFQNQTVSVGGKPANGEPTGTFEMDPGPLSRTLFRFKETLPAAGGRAWLIARDVQRRSKDQAPITVPPGCYYVLADNRNHGRDSREYGCVQAARLRGTVVRHAISLLKYDPIE